MNRLHPLSFALATLTTLAAAALTHSAGAAPHHHDDDGSASLFRAQGTLVISATNGGGIGSTIGSESPTPLLFWGHTSGDAINDPGDNNHTTARSNSRFLLTPAFDYFLIDGLSLGGELLVGHHSDSIADTRNGTTRTTETSGNTFGFAPRIGYDVALTDGLSLWIRGGIGYLRDGTNAADGAGSRSSSRWSIGADVQLLWHLHPNFFVGVGPGVSRELGSSVTDDNGQGTTVTTDQGKNTHWRFLAFTIGGVF